MNNNLMYEFMAEIDIPLPFDKNFVLLIPEQRAVINNLMNERIVTSYAVSVEEGKLWVTIVADSAESVTEILMGFPIIEFVEYNIYKLAFHNNAGTLSAQFSLN